MNFCRRCGQDFGSVEAFDAHRVGAHAYTYAEGMRLDPPHEDGRRCLSMAEMVEVGKFAQNAQGRWSLSESIARARRLHAPDTERRAA